MKNWFRLVTIMVLAVFPALSPVAFAQQTDADTPAAESAEQAVLSEQEQARVRAQNLYERGRFEYDDGNYADALNFFNDAIKENPENINFYISRGQSLFKLQRYEEAEAQFIALSERGPQARDIMFVELGALYGHTRQYDKAIENYSQAIKVFPQRADLYLARGAMHMEKGEYAQADADFVQAGKMKPDLAAAVAYHRALVTFQQEDYEQTKKYLDQAGSMNPDRGLAKAVSELKDIVKKEERVYKDWNVTLSIAASKDDNVTLQPLSADVQPSEKEDDSLTFTGMGTYYFYNRRAGNAGMFYQYQQLSYANLNFSDVTSHTTGLFYSVNRNPIFYRIQADVGYYYSDRQDYMTRWSLTPSFAWLMTARDRLSFFGTIERKARHDDGDSSNHYVFNATYTKNIIPAKTRDTIGIISRIGFQWEYEDPDDEPAALVASRYNIYELQMGMSFPLPYKFEGDIGLRHALVRYEENQNKYGGLERIDERTIATFKLGRQLTDQFRTDFLYTFTTNKSNLASGGVSVYDFHRNVFTVIFTGSF